MAAETFARTTVGTVPLFYGTSTAPFLCGLVVRVGRVDETLVTSGTTHLVEHLALKTEWPPDEFNASVSEVFTHFWFSGEPARALERLAVTAAGLRALPVQHLPRERQILRTEASGRGVHQLSLHSSLRFGPVGPALLYYDEYGLARVTRSDVRTGPRATSQTATPSRT